MSSLSNSSPRPTNFWVQEAKSVKAMQILVIVRALLALVFYIVFSINDITIGAVGPEIILYTFLGFSLLAIPIFYFIRKRNLLATRISIIVDLLAALPATAFISIVLSVVIFGLSFSKSAKAYFQG
ncbi:MAG: hypothetical protein AAFN10_22505 [Bacteroidota bacterium]